MPWSETPFAVPLLLAAVTGLLLAAYTLGRRERLDPPAVAAFVTVALATTVWTGAYTQQLAATTVAAKLAWTRVVWVGVALTAVGWPVFVLAYTGHRRVLRARALAALAALPALCVLAVWSANYRWLLLTPVDLHDVAGITVLEIAPGPLFVLFLCYSYALDVVAIGLLARAASTRRGTRRREAAALCLGSVLPLAASVASVAVLHPYPYVDATPMAFGVTIPLVAVVLFRYRPLSLVPVARTQLLEEMSDGLIVLNAAERVVDANATARALLGDGTGLIGRPAERALADHPALLDAMERPADGERSVVIERDGERRHYDVSVSVVRDSLGAVSGTLVSLRDITRRRELEQWYQSIVDRSTTIVAVTDAEGGLRYATPSFERTLGYDPGDIVGERVTDFIHPDDVPAFQSSLADANEHGTGALREVRVRDAEDGWHVIEGQARDLRDDPVIGGYLLSGHDVTARRRTEQRLQALNRVLRHDVRNELSVVQGYVSMARERVDDEEVREWLERAHSASEKLLDVSETSRYVDAELERDPEVARADVTGAVADAVAAVERTHPDVRVAVDAPESARADVTRLFEFAVEHLVRTAAEHAASAGEEVAVCVERTPSGVELRVRLGERWLSEGDERVLEQGEESPLAHADGLGFWIVHWAVTAADGTIAVAEDGRVVVLRLRDPDAS
ncbi:PAS domain-containing protein [Halarchaeum sp. CBA1220]|uniref:histidine kinase N-terminal 7TM domain-containing protein n=1 Tax=Halarchaeum sp. CBA1220 TaxID=1853682 RepID=UPI000F3A9156|nr:histidine kinase N-terminal 7TM domain-containing protein [Halarchaeum sp. CBA1220]QLC33684.1 PAS domain-containing protein [Halarchaeum sp. CBA1220]